MSKHTPMVVMLISGDLTKLQVGLSLAATASASARSVTLFTTGEATYLLSPANRHKLTDSDGRDYATRAKDQGKQGIADLDLLLEALSALPVRLMVCDAALFEHGIDPEGLITRPNFERSGLTELVADHVQGG